VASAAAMMMMMMVIVVTKGFSWQRERCAVYSVWMG